MAWSDLSDVTAALTRLLKLYIEHVLSPGLTITALGTPPDQLGNSVTNTLSLYLYHVRESAEAQNRPGRGSEAPGIATAPLGLDLFYVLTAHQRANAQFDAAGEQRLMGFAMQTLHDIPVITDATSVAAVNVIQGGERGRGNRLNIELTKLDPEHAFAIWTTGERQFTRLAAYYRVGLVLLEPQPPRQIQGIVLTLGAFVVPGGRPQLTDTLSDLRFALPAAAGGSTQALRAQPARPFLLSAPATDATFTVVGDALGAGAGRRVVLRNTRWQQLVPAADRVPVDAAAPANVAAGWQVVFQAARFGVRIGPTLTFEPEGGGPPRTLVLYPGMYLLQLEIEVAAPPPANPAAPLRLTSNTVVVGICPRLAGDAILGATSLRLDIDPAFQLLPPATEPPLEIQLVIDGQVYRRIDAGVPVAGEFIVSASSLTVETQFSTAAAGLHPVQLTIEGADAQPWWIETP
jgi:hypothetical protein